MTYEKQGTGYDSGASGHELQGRATASKREQAIEAVRRAIDPSAEIANIRTAAERAAAALRALPLGTFADEGAQAALQPFADAYREMLKTQAKMRAAGMTQGIGMPDNEFVDVDEWEDAKMTFGDFRRAADAIRSG